jgi:transcriptional regulator with GAF, ATPase, and Fis domain
VARLPDVPVLLTGESGTGKELAARLIHDLDPRADKQKLVVLDCTTIVPTLSGSEFFGHERGAFTDAVATRDGAISEADRGSLFLDELGELPLSLQAELLRVSQEGTYKRVGSSVWRQSRFRLVCATNRDLRQEVAAGRFRADLYHRIAAWTVHLPPLGGRPDDIPALATHFLRQLRPDLGEPAIDDAVLDVLQRRAYPGNVRELRQLVARMSGRHVGPAPITVGDLPGDERPRNESPDVDRRDDGLERWVRAALAGNAALRDIRRAAEATAITIALEQSAGNLHGASRRLKVTDRALQLRRAAARKNGTES